MIVGDLFAGVGGMSEGFKMAGFDIAFAVEFDKEIAMAYQKNHIGTDVHNVNISDIDVSELHKKHPNVDVIIGGPPCQGFSQKGQRLSLDDPRNFLFQQYVRFVKEFMPKYFVLENVPNIITTSNGFSVSTAGISISSCAFFTTSFAVVDLGLTGSASEYIVI